MFVIYFFIFKLYFFNSIVINIYKTFIERFYYNLMFLIYIYFIVFYLNQIFQFFIIFYDTIMKCPKSFKNLLLTFLLTISASVSFL